MQEEMLRRANAEIERLIAVLEIDAVRLNAQGIRRSELYSQIAVALVTAGASLLGSVGGRELAAEALYRLADGAACPEEDGPPR